MARKLTPESAQTAASGPVSGKHNLANRRECIRKGFQDLYEIDCEIAAKTEQHIEGLKKSRTKKWRELKADLDIDRQILSLDYKKFKLERDAAGSVGGNDAIIDGFREIHEALAEGGIVDWVDSLNEVEVKPPPSNGEDAAEQAAAAGA